jgi:hypothetical protein
MRAIVVLDDFRCWPVASSAVLQRYGANRELAQWLLDHPRYSAPVVAGWLGCGDTRIKELRRWAEGGFIGTQSRRSERHDRRRAADAPLKSQDNPGADSAHESDDDGSTSEVADPEVIKENLLDTVSQAAARRLPSVSVSCAEPELSCVFNSGRAVTCAQASRAPGNRSTSGSEDQSGLTV